MFVVHTISGCRKIILSLHAGSHNWFEMFMCIIFVYSEIPHLVISVGKFNISIVTDALKVVFVILFH